MYDGRMKSNPKTPFQQFTRAMDALMQVPHSELKEILDREKQQRERKKRAKTSPASRVSNAKA